MVRIAGAGDNVVDCYKDQGRMFPGGNTLNVSVFARRAGAESAYVGAVADDPAGRAIQAALRAEGVSTERLRVLPGSTAWCMIGHDKGDRIFLSADLGVSMFEPDPADFAYLSGFDAVHVSKSSGLDDHLATLANLSRLSYDFSIKRDHPQFDEIAGLCFLASLSGGDLSEGDARDLLERTLDRGAEWVLVTRGSDGALLGGGGRLFQVPAVPCEVIDTLGAGDTFIAQVLVGLLGKRDPELLLHQAALAAAQTCLRYGAIGHGVPIDIGPAQAGARPEPAL